jgi:hypothetical protein
MNRRSFFRLSAGIAGAVAVAPKVLLEPTHVLYDCDKATAARWLASFGKPIEVVSGGTDCPGFVEAIRRLSGGWFEFDHVGTCAFRVAAPASKIPAIKAWLDYHRPMGVLFELKEMKFNVDGEIVSL